MKQKKVILNEVPEYMYISYLAVHVNHFQFPCLKKQTTMNYQHQVNNSLWLHYHKDAVKTQVVM